MSFSGLANNINVRIQRSRESLRSTYVQKDNNANKDSDSGSIKSTRSTSSIISLLTGGKLKHQKSQSEPAATQTHPASIPRPSHTRRRTLSVFKKSAASGSYYHPYTVYETNMSPPVLGDVEATRKLLEIIHDTPSGSRTVARLGRTCKAFNEPAMDVLWDELDSFLPLVALFPGYIMKRVRRPGLGLVRLVSKCCTPRHIKSTGGDDNGRCADHPFDSTLRLRCPSMPTGSTCWPTPTV